MSLHLFFLFPCSIVHQRQWCHQAGIHGQIKGGPPRQGAERQLSTVLGRNGLHQWRAGQQILQVRLVREIATQGKSNVFCSLLFLLPPVYIVHLVHVYLWLQNHDMAAPTQPTIVIVGCQLCAALWVCNISMVTEHHLVSSWYSILQGG